MKKLFTILSLVIMIGCKKESLTENKSALYLNYYFEVGEQVNVSHYTIQVSSDEGKSYEDVATVPGAASDIYTVKIDVTRWFTSSSILSRIKEVDIDGKIQYSKVSLTQK